MVYLELVGIEGDEVVYDYMPERKDADRGTVAVNRKTGERTLRKQSADGLWSAYHRQAWKRIEEMIAEGELKQDAYAAWY